MLLSCAIVCYRNSESQLDQVVESVVRSALEKPGLTLALTIVDNSPTDRLRKLAERHGARYLHRADNPGFGAAHNIAIAQSLEEGAAYHLVLNPDVHFDREVLPALVDYMEQHVEIGLLMPDIRYPDGRRQYLCKLLPTPADLFLRRFLPGPYRWAGRLARYELHESGYSRVMDVPSLSGCFMLLRVSVLREVGAFDERFFMYLEDVDLCRRVGSVTRTVFFPSVSITHQYVKGSYKNWRLLYNHIRSAVLYFNKWGWFFDRQRRLVNRRCVQRMRGKQVCR